jgi:hypothetical protein
MAARTFVATVTPANGGAPVDVVVFAEGAFDAKCKIEAMHGPIRSWWSQPSEAGVLKSFSATIIREGGGEPVYVTVLADGRIEAEAMVQLKYGPVRSWLSQLTFADETNLPQEKPHFDFD